MCGSVSIMCWLQYAGTIIAKSGIMHPGSARLNFIACTKSIQHITLQNVPLRVTVNTTPHHTTSHYTTSHHATTHHITSHHATTHHTTLHHTTPHHTTIHHTPPHHNTPHHTTPHYTTIKPHGTIDSIYLSVWEWFLRLDCRGGWQPFQMLHVSGTRMSYEDHRPICCSLWRVRKEGREK